MPDAHLAEHVCVGAVTVTDGTIIPAAVGGDIGCGMVAVPLSVTETSVDARSAARVLHGLERLIPPLVHPIASAPALPDELAGAPLSAPALDRMKGREARSELGTVGRGNHFVELQAASDGRLWVLVHSGSRAMGPAICQFHQARAPGDIDGIRYFPDGDPRGLEYLRDAAWAAEWASFNRARSIDAVRTVVGDVWGADLDDTERIEVDHNHVHLETHGGEQSWIHRKGAMGLPAGAIGIVPGSMGTATYHVEGRGCPEAYDSSAHGAGRALARGEARRVISKRRLLTEVDGIYFDRRRAQALREEAPSAYKDVDEVMRAQRELVRVVRSLRPLIVYKAG
ncbi:MAG: RtcB family protein [Polyangiaceae bacterium]|nr:RtcB family protein [Polyangiaceae bacterium]